MNNVTNKGYECDDPMVSHPNHYQSKNGLEVIDVVEAFTDGLNGIEATDTGNVLKYMCRWKTKNGLQDLKKAMWYLTHLINKVEAESKKPSESKVSPTDSITLATRKDAKAILSCMNQVINDYGYMSVADLYDLIGVQTNYEDCKYGWTDLRLARVAKVREGYALVLPKTVSIN